MCQINEKATNKKECKCNLICCQMQNNSLRCAIKGLRKTQYNSAAIIKILKATDNLLEVYSCLPGTCLRKRVQWVYGNIRPDKWELTEGEKNIVNMLISELEIFVDSNR